MNIQRNVSLRLEEEYVNAEGPRRGDQVPSLEKDVNDDQAPMNPPLTNENIRASLLKWPKPLLQKDKPPLLKPKP